MPILFQMDNYEGSVWQWVIQNHESDSVTNMEQYPTRAEK